MRRVALLGMAVLAACAPLQSGDPASPHYAWSTGWSVRLERPLTIAAGEATVRLQYGRIVPRNSVQEHHPFCIVELETVGETAQTLQPGRFEVWRVTRSVDPVSAAVATPWVRTRLIEDDGDPSFLYFVTAFRLRDPAQPALRGMRCAWNQMAPGNRHLMRHLTLAEIRGALGGWMTFLPPGERA